MKNIHVIPTPNQSRLQKNKYNKFFLSEEPKQDEIMERFIANAKQQETLEEAAVIYAHRSFVWPLNKQGEKQSIPPGQLVPPGYAKHQKVATKHFTNGAKWQSEISYGEEDLRIAFTEGHDSARMKGSYKSNGTFEEDWILWFEQFKKK
jgi:hypothetical protein